MLKTIWELKTGKARQVDVVDFKEIMRMSPDLYTDDESKVNVTDTMSADVVRNAGNRGGTRELTSDEGFLMPREMSIAQLRAALDEKGVQYDANLKKADLVMLADIAEIKIKKPD